MHLVKIMLAVAVALALSTSASAVLIPLTAAMNGPQATAGLGTGSPGTGLGTITLDTVTKQLSWSITWGGLIGISGAPPLLDGGRLTVPTFRQYDPDGTWFPEGHGVEPDIPVVDDPALMARGGDPQLERAVQEALRLLAEAPVPTPTRPAYERRTPRQ